MIHLLVDPGEEVAVHPRGVLAELGPEVPTQAVAEVREALPEILRPTAEVQRMPRARGS